MKTPFSNTDLEMRLLSKRDPRNGIAASNINLHGAHVRPQCNTSHLLSDLQDEKRNSNSDVDFSSFAFYVEE